MKSWRRFALAFGILAGAATLWQFGQSANIGPKWIPLAGGAVLAGLVGFKVDQRANRLIADWRVSRARRAAMRENAAYLHRIHHNIRDSLTNDDYGFNIEHVLDGICIATAQIFKNVTGHDCFCTIRQYDRDAGVVKYLKHNSLDHDQTLFPNEEMSIDLFYSIQHLTGAKEGLSSDRRCFISQNLHQDHRDGQYFSYALPKAGDSEFVAEWDAKKRLYSNWPLPKMNSALVVPIRWAGTNPRQASDQEVVWYGFLAVNCDGLNHSGNEQDNIFDVVHDLELAGAIADAVFSYAYALQLKGLLDELVPDGERRDLVF